MNDFTTQPAHSKGATGRTVNKLTAKQAWQLTQLVQKEWEAQSPESDEVFAEFARTKLDFTITHANVATSRETLDIPSPNARGQRSNVAEIADLQRRLERLEQRVEVYLKGCRGDGVRS